MRRADDSLNMQSDLTRRGFMRAGAGAAALGGAAWLAACGGSSSGAGTSSATTAGAGTPVRGGTLTLGGITGGSQESCNPQLAIVPIDEARVRQLYDYLFYLSPDVIPMLPGLALSAEPNKDATLWTFKLRHGVTWHDGKPFTADDVVYTMKTWANPTSLSNGLVAGILDYNGVRKLDGLTVEVPLLSPCAQFPSLSTDYRMAILQNGATRQDLAHRPIGTGPFKFVSFTPGQQSVFVRNENYWMEGKPYVDHVVVDTSFTDEESRLNALLGGTLNVLPVMDPVQAKQQLASNQITVHHAPSAVPYGFMFRLDKGVFSDVRVRQAMMLIPDRPAIVAGAMAGLGTVGHDLMGSYCEYFDNSLTREQDIPKAKALLKAAGQENLTFTFPVSAVAAGATEAVTLFAEQAKAAGVTINVSVLPASNYFSTSTGYGTRPVGWDETPSEASLTAYYRSFLTAAAPYPDTHWAQMKPGGAAAEALLTEAIGTVDRAKANELWHEVQLQQFNEGGQLIYANPDNIDGFANNVRGLQTTTVECLNQYRLLDGWIDDKS